MPDAVLIHDDQYANWTLGAHHPTQGRRFTNGARALRKAVASAKREDLFAPGYTLDERAPHANRSGLRRHIESMHTVDHVAEVIEGHTSTEWEGQRPDLAHLATLFLAGTLDAADALINGETLTAVHLPGAKHHAHANYASGFCVFNDFAIAARHLCSHGLRVAIFDFDAHHGDGTEALVRDMPDVLHFSTHEWGIFPGTGDYEDDFVHHVHNRPVHSEAGGLSLLHAVSEFIKIARDFVPDVILVAAGADGHKQDPLSTLNYTQDWYHRSGRDLRRAFRATPMLIGGAGGYRPDDVTPATWADFALPVITGASR